MEKVRKNAKRWSIPVPDEDHAKLGIVARHTGIRMGDLVRSAVMTAVETEIDTLGLRHLLPTRSRYAMAPSSAPQQK